MTWEAITIISTSRLHKFRLNWLQSPAHRAHEWWNQDLTSYYIIPIAPIPFNSKTGISKSLLAGSTASGTAFPNQHRGRFCWFITRLPASVLEGTADHPVWKREGTVLHGAAFRILKISQRYLINGKDVLYSQNIFTKLGSIKPLP